ncbi:MAG: type IV pilus biogenesis protein PilM [Candidatus Paceibacterota bacterium]
MSTKGFLRFFPVPSYLLMPATCVSVSDSVLRHVELKRGKRSIELKNYLEKDIPSGSVEAGEIVDRKALMSSLRELKDELNLDQVALSLPEENGYVYTVHIPAEDEGVTEDQVAFTLEKNVPFAVDEVVFDYVETGASNKSGREVVVMVLPYEMVQSYIDILKEAEITPLYFEIESYSLSRAVVNSGDPRTHILAHIQKESTNISIVSRNIPRFTSVVRRGVDTEGEDDIHRSALWLKEELDRVRSYWQSHGSKNTGAPQTVILCGEMENHSSEKDIIASGLDMEVNIANVWENVTSFDDYIPDIPFSKSLEFGGAVGLALKEFKRKN